MSDGYTREAALARLDALSRLFDIAFAIPGTNVRFGVEAILRLVPGVGDVAASALSCYLIYEARRLGAPPRIFARMLANVAIEGIIGRSVSRRRVRRGVPRQPPQRAPAARPFRRTVDNESGRPVP